MVRAGYAKLRFNPSGVLDSEAQLKFHVLTNTTSAELEPQQPIVLVINVIKRAEVSIKGLGRPEQVRLSFDFVFLYNFTCGIS